MRWAWLLCLPYLLIVTPQADARPEFARREQLACGFCHIQPRGGGPRNSNGLTYARNEFKFPKERGTLNSFPEGRQRDAMVRARKMLRINNVREAREELTRLSRQLKEGPARELVDAELHAIAVRGDEILGQARLLLRKRSEKKRATGVELLYLLSSEYRGLPVRDKAAADLKELKKDKKLAELLKREEAEQKARLLLLEALAQQSDGKAKRAAKSLEKLEKKYPDSRAARRAVELKTEKKQKAK
ncbi:MAG: hypothetical protein ACYTHK_05685 [Planctomycetota bacterium]|jgi:hypothetical protein